MSPKPKSAIFTSPKTTERGDFEYFEEMLPDRMREDVRRMQIQTVARMIRNVAKLKEEMCQLTQLGSW